MRKIFFSIIFCLSILAIQAKIYDIKSLGADTSGKVACTDLIKQSIKNASAEGGGTIYFPAGTYLTAAIHLESNITLDIESGAVMKFSTTFEDYLPFVKVRWEGVFMNSLSPLIYADKAENITIKGRGVIDGQGHTWWKESRRLIDEIRKDGKTSATNKLQQMWLDANKGIKVSPYYESTLERKFFRPPFIQFHESKNILIEGITIINSPFWTINPIGCDDLLIHGVTINNPSSNPKGHNTDGINPESCRNVRISDCFLSVGDDCITIKSGRDEDGRNYGRPCENITITNCIMLAGHGGVVIGSEMSGGVRNIKVSNCQFLGTDVGLRFKSNRQRGGTVENIYISNMSMFDIPTDPLSFNLYYGGKSEVEELEDGRKVVKEVASVPVTDMTPVFRNIYIKDVICSSARRAMYFNGLPEQKIENINVEKVTIH